MTEQTVMTASRSFQSYATKRISYVLPTKNKAHFIGKALDMAKRLVGPEDELIVVDGGSTDGTAEIVASYGDLVDVFISEPDLSPSHASNKGMLVARGRYIKWLTDDDEFFPEAMEQAIEVLEAHPEVDILLCGGTSQVGEEVRSVYVPPGANYGKSPEDVFKYTASGMGVLVRRSALSQIGLTDPLGAAADGEFLARAIANKANVRFCRINMYHNTIHEHSTIVAKRRAWERDFDRIVKLYCSLGFYVRYRIKSAVLRNPVLREPAITVLSVLRHLVARLRGGGIGEKSADSPIWDRGLS